MTRQEYEAKLTDLQSQIEELKQTEIEEDSPKPPHPRWKPLLGNTFYTVESVIETGCGYNWLSDNNTFDKGIFEAGQVYQTKEQAEEEVERLKVLAEMKEWSGRWDDPYALGYNRLLSPLNRIIVIDRKEFSTLGEMRFATKIDAENCLETVGYDRLAKYYFGVEESRDDKDDKDN